ncbi:hypothetical protein JQT66_10995 [Sulfitobacter mediterraneus]|uniref:hypothetical protein n=1 Tax=Sulfitobacter mediterraneus TaxID=83219 RepID=UPI0019321F3A|nr:hypothetical protein [Sulfitobacter mediterraneus]MBM1310757.1 hypothetical protein [Sulfitobacter mediterraneus]MBM1314641.1 hypothetical protein [Sulfitobacter mediterraneus]MBM1323001.1 hypothetical protein [Sulfitobacter mediterraneus]MBM1326913.1 hypothetical protein [Sulfitobacter mediterraneus]MBM1398259.1 hypothetical protein [Sulfitobacter mediterraneus]
MSLIDTFFSVLMVGHSLFGQDGPDRLGHALTAGTGGAQVQAQIINGAPLRYNWDHGSDAEGVNARQVLPEGEITHLILTEALPLANHVTWSDSSFFAQSYAELAIAANPAAQVFVMETWHSLKSGTGEAVDHDEGADVPWRSRIDADLPVWERIVDEINAGLPRGVPAARLIPAGQAMGRLYDAINAGEVAGVSSITALFSDDIHLNDLGHYFVSQVQFAALTGQSPEGLPGPGTGRWGGEFQTLDPALATALQQIAWDTVAGYLGEAVVRAPATKASAEKAPNMPTGPPLPEPAQLVAADLPLRGAGAIGLAPVTDWSSQQPFLDVMKTARPWFGHLPKRWGGVDHEVLRDGGYLDAQGWPIRMPDDLSSIGTVVLTDMPEAATSLAGRYLLRFDGDVVIEVAGRASNIRYDTGEVRFDYTPGPGSVDIRLQRIGTAAPLGEITLVREDRAALLDQGALFNPDWTARLTSFEVLRFMDWMETNNSDLAAWEHRPLPGNATYMGGVPIEVMIRLGNEMGKDIWVNVPHQATDDFVQRFAAMARVQLDPGRKVYVEYSNEVWNWQFDQARWADEQARDRWGEDNTWMQYYGLRAAEVAQIWSAAFAAGTKDQLVNVISSQTGWLGLEDAALNAPLAQAQGLSAPKAAFDAYAVTGYFGGVLGLEDREDMVKGWLADSLAKARADASAQGLNGQEAIAYIAAHRYDLASAFAGRELHDGAVSGNPEDTLADLIGRVWPYHAQVAADHGLDLIMYEGGSHIVGLGPQIEDAELTAFFHHFNYTQEMGDLYRTLLAGWQSVGGKLFNAYSDVYSPTKWGSWGGLRHLDDQNPRWNALTGNL